MPGPHDLVAKVLQLPNIPRDAVVGKVTIEYRSQPGVLFTGRQGGDTSRRAASGNKPGGRTPALPLDGPQPKD
jgi:hypothetical protein